MLCKNSNLDLILKNGRPKKKKKKKNGRPSNSEHSPKGKFGPKSATPFGFGVFAQGPPHPRFLFSLKSRCFHI